MALNETEIQFVACEGKVDPIPVQNDSPTLPVRQ